MQNVWQLCDAVEWFVANSDVSIDQVVDDQGNRLEIKNAKEISIKKQETLFLPTNSYQLFPNLDKLNG